MPNSNQILGGGGGFHHVALRVRDFDKSVRFYQELLGFVKKVSWGAAPKRGILLDTGDGNYMELFERPSEKPIIDEGPILHFAFRCTNVDEVTERARAAGYAVIIEPKDAAFDSPEMGKVPIHISFFRGPDGEQVELFDNQLT